MVLRGNPIAAALVLAALAASAAALLVSRPAYRQPAHGHSVAHDTSPRDVGSRRVPAPR